MPPNTVYVGRGTDWGNPFIPGKRFNDLALWIAINGVMTREQIDEWHANDGFLVRDGQHALECYRKYAAWMIRDTDVRWAWLVNLVGKNLACWCPLDQPCHADILLELANSGNVPTQDPNEKDGISK
jgi:hypothetical protein